MKTYPILYSLTSTGATQIWFCESDGHGRFRSTSGQKDGAKTCCEWTVCEGKNLGKANETSPAEQAEKEIAALYKKKKKDKYFDSEDELGEDRFIKPMLAKQWEDYKEDIDWSEGVYISPKMDGLRAVIANNKATSRGGGVFVSFPHILREIEPVLEDYPELVLDGEVYTDKLKTDFNKIISLAKQSKPTNEDLIESEKWLEYHVFDCPSAPGGFHDRYKFLESLFEKYFKGNKWIKLCKHKLIKKESEIDENLQKYIEQGYEGLMVNIYDGEYFGKRSKNILKYKLFQDEEFKITDVTEGVGNRSGMMGYISLVMKNGNTFDANARGNEELYTEILKNKKNYIGKMATIRYQNLTPDGIPRFPVVVNLDRSGY